MLFCSDAMRLSSQAKTVWWHDIVKYISHCAIRGAFFGFASRRRRRGDAGDAEQDAVHEGQHLSSILAVGGLGFGLVRGIQANVCADHCSSY